MHIIILNPLNINLELIHVTLDLIGQISIIAQALFEYVLGICGFTPGQIAVILTVIATLVDLAGMAIINFCLSNMLLGFMVFDATMSLIALGVGTGFLIATIAATWVFSDLIRTQFDDPGWSIVVWFMLLMAIIGTAFGASKSTFAGDHQDDASALFSFASSKLGYSSGTGVGIYYGLTTKLALASLGAFCIFAMWVIFSQL